MEPKMDSQSEPKKDPKIDAKGDPMKSQKHCNRKALVNRGPAFRRRLAALPTQIGSLPSAQFDIFFEGPKVTQSNV